ncbi:hypothetical protein [Bosea massiliensis]|jgi:hypothetical protein|uniref:Uncharacterized protein n=1 Tax=Bosea massiliensis TaxID=151419 RepID=A0ABW0NZD8_9HYPH
MTVIPFDPERHITPSEIAAIRGPFVQRPKDIDPREWLRWAQEVVDAEPLARQILEAQARKAAAAAGR